MKLRILSFIFMIVFVCTPLALNASAVDAGCFDAVFTAMENHEESVNISSYRVPVDDVNVIATWVHNNAPLSCGYLSSYGYSYSRTDGEWYLGDLYFTYDLTVEQMAQTYAAADAMLEDLEGNEALSDVEKALLVHDRLAVVCEYDYASYLDGSIPDVSYTVYGALVLHRAVCTGYARAYAYLMNRLGVPAEYVNSDELCHAWNILTIDGVRYHVDVTWDDPVWDRLGRVKHENFLRSTAGLVSTGHDTSDYDTSPVDVRYDSAVWQDSDTQFCLLNGELYFLDYRGRICRWNGGEPTVLLNVGDVWPSSGGGYWIGQFSSLTTDGTALYYSDSRSVYRYLPGGEPELIYTPDYSDLPGYYLYGFTYLDGVITAQLDVSPNMNGGSVFTVREYTLPATVVGDLNGDGILSILDVSLLLAHLSHGEYNHVYDINGDGVASIQDVTKLLYLISI